ncbi:MAG: glycoside hydrolase family 2 [Bacteroides sp.]|nr:glycoside hydrolase family 2 [Bacteroides sp.]
MKKSPKLSVMAAAMAALALYFPTDGLAKTVYPFPFAPSTGLLNEVEKPLRQEICLNGSWDFQPVKTPKDYKQGAGVAPELPEPTADGWSSTKIKIPSPWNINSFAYRGLEGPDHRNYPSYPKEWDNCLMGWLRRTVKVPADWNGSDIRLYFEAVAGEAEVYVNGHKVGENFDLFLPFSCDITEYVKPGETAEILVGVRSQKLFEDNSTIGRRIVPAGSMWGYHINGIWQDVYLLAQPKINISDVYVKPLVSQNKLEVEVALTNNTPKKADVNLQGDVREWINLAGTDVNSAPVPKSRLGEIALSIPSKKVAIPAGETVKVTLSVPVDSRLDFWTPENPALYGLVLSLGNKKEKIDTKYERFGWREWTLSGTQQLLNGEPYQLRSDSWHFQGIPQMTRRYAWSWFKAIKDMNGNAVRPHAQVYPRFYLDMADEMGICVLDETANWASDGGPKLDSEKFWENSKDHLSRFVKRDRNHASVFGWSISNENKPVILYVYNRPDLMPLQEQAWADWRDIVRELDPTRPWISSDGEDDGDGVLPVTVGHYGDRHSMENWKNIGKPWGMGEHSMAYYGTPEQVSKYNGERAYESQEGRMEGLANECYNLIKDQRDMGASFSTIFNMAWYGLQPLPLGKEDLSTKPSLEDDGIFFSDYVEGVPGVQPERVGPYSSTFNPGYDPSLPLYEEWPLFAALRAANAPGQPAWSPWAEIDKTKYEAPAAIPAAPYKEVVFVGGADSRAKTILDNQGVVWTSAVKSPASALLIVDGAAPLSAADAKKVKAAMDKGADVWVWGLVPETVASFEGVLPAPVNVEALNRSSYLPEQRSWVRGFNNSDFYFCELQKADASKYSLSGALVDNGEVMLNACRTDWRTWNKRPEELKTAATLRSENENTAALPVFVKYPGDKGGDVYVSTITEFANSEKGFNTLSTLLHNAGVSCRKQELDPNDVFWFRDGNVILPASAAENLKKTDDGWELVFYAFSPRPLDDLLIEPNVPKLELEVKAKKASLKVGDADIAADQGRNEARFKELPLKQGWNRLVLHVGDADKNGFNGFFKCNNNASFMPQMKAAYVNPETK